MPARRMPHNRNHFCWARIPQQCRSCARNGYGPDAWLPATSEFFPMQYGREG